VLRVFLLELVTLFNNCRLIVYANPLLGIGLLDLLSQNLNVDRDPRSDEKPSRLVDKATWNKS
jgi:hypothetical protein